MPNAENPMTPSHPTGLVANWETLQRIFIRPENDAARTVLLKYMEQILFGLHDFLKQHLGITQEASLKELADRFTESRISEHPVQKLADVINGLIEEVAPHAVNVASPYFIGHMTSAIPFYMVHLATIVAALNQNPVKLETSKIVSVLERQVLAKLHRMVYGFGDDFYDHHIQKPESTLGGFVEDGTLANMTALWVARNTLLGSKPGFDGVEGAGMAAALSAYGLQRCVILVSRLAHYSLQKSAGILGIGNRNVLPVPVDGGGRADIRALAGIIDTLKRDEPGTRIVAIIGIAGTTETGTVDPLDAMADICEREGIHFHVDAAWGGPTLLSETYRHLLTGIERADSVTIDGHKQFYMPMSCGMIYFKQPTRMDAVAYHARYINRPGSVDLGIRSLVGSRAATSLVLGSALDIMGTRGYALLIDHGIELARAFADEIMARPMFQLVTRPCLNILTYRLLPDGVPADSERANEINKTVQRLQREAGRSFVSRTTLSLPETGDTVVLRAVLMNPFTTIEILREILDEQGTIYRREIAGRP